MVSFEGKPKEVVMDNVNNSSVHVYNYRWIILLIFALSAAISFVQFLQYSIISNITEKYYHVSDIEVEIAGLMFPIVFIILCLPTNYLVEKYNLRISMVISTGLTAAGALLKIPAVHEDRFYLVLVGQFLCSVAQIVLISIPSKVASLWFGPEQVSTACALAVFGTQIGTAIGCVWPSNAIKNSNDLESIGDDFFEMMITNGVIASVLFLLVLFFYRARPKLPPSQSQVNLMENENPSFVSVIKAMVKNRDYCLLLLSFGVSTGLWTANGLLINDIYLNYFPDSESDIGIISALSVLAGGCLGSIIFGYFLDKYHRFRLIAFIVNIGSAIAEIFVCLSLTYQNKISSYFTLPLFGFFMGSTILTSFEFVTEVMYPMPESASCGVLTAVVNIFAIVFTLIMNEIIEYLGYLAAYIFMFVCLLISSAIIYFISSNLNRRKANVQNQ